MNKKKGALSREIKKFREIPGAKDKAVYIWDYYKLHLAIILGSIIVLAFGIYYFTHNKSENWIYVMFTNTFEDVGNGSDFWEEFRSYSGYDINQKNIEFNNSAYFIYPDNAVGNSYYEAFVTYTEGGTLDAVVMDPEHIQSLGESGRLLDLEGEAAAELFSEYKDRFIYSTPYDTEYSTSPVPVAIDISDSRLITEYSLYEDGCALGIGANSSHLDAVLKFLDFLYETTSQSNRQDANS